MNVNSTCGGASIDASTPDFIPDASAPLCTAPINPGPNHFQFVVDQFLMPTSATTANLYGLNIDGDKLGRHDNALGQVLAALVSGLNFESQSIMDAQVNSGALIYLVDVVSTDIVTATGTQLAMVRGQDCEVPTDSSDNFSGSEPFLLSTPASSDTPVAGPIANSVLDLHTHEHEHEHEGGGKPLPYIRSVL